MDIERLEEHDLYVLRDVISGLEEEQSIDFVIARQFEKVIDEAIDRQSVTSEKVTEAIDLLKEIQHDKYVIQNHTENDVKNYELVSFAIAVLKKYQPKGE